MTLQSGHEASDFVDLRVFLPEIFRSGLAEVKFFLKGGLHILHVAVEHGDCNYRSESCDSGDGDSEEGNLLQAFGLHCQEFLGIFFLTHLQRQDK